MRRSSPVQQWLDSLPADASEGDTTGHDTSNSLPETSDDHESKDSTTDPTLEKTCLEKPPVEVETSIVLSHEDKLNLDVPISKDMWKRKSLESGMLTSSPKETPKKKLQRDYSVQSEGPPKIKNPLFRDASLQSDASGSSGSSVLNVLSARKVDAESVLLELGFGPSEKQQMLQRIPDRFLVPSKLKGISTEKFIKDEQHSMRMHDCGVFGYRGLTGNPHAPPSTIVAKIMECILHEDASAQASARARHSIADISSAHAQIGARFFRDA
ncbi:uncharacterized protein LOC105384739 isoform X1 [Plutella xylostella]|uniref:uncharacterized protein LOC105384739 isoform X1 n=1 Tax=Plutella xylostella TaxID=51655 RepID=UPI0020326D53|nr:uncharacterized protein LOC105384739 isoform X1 [Plutella xylostella]